MEQYLKNLVKVLAIGAAFAAIPLFASLAELQPPWPPAIGYVSAALVLLASLIAWEWVRAAKRRSRRWMIIAAVALSVAGLLAYLPLYSLFIEDIPGEDVRVVRGYSCTPEAKEVYGAQCPDLPRDALKDAEWEPEVLWTRGSVATVRVALTAAWLMFVTGLILAVGSVVAGRRFGDAKRARPRSDDRPLA